jgi:hypothetical protein
MRYPNPTVRVTQNCEYLMLGSQGDRAASGPALPLQHCLLNLRREDREWLGRSCSSDRLLRSDRIAVPGLLRRMPHRPHTFGQVFLPAPQGLGSLAGSELDAGSHEIAFLCR